MPRLPREYNEIKVYHIILRGIDKQDIFFDDKDRYKFLEIIKETKIKYDYEVYAYCLMNNHIHVVIYDKTNLLSKIMQSIEISYSIYFNKKYERIGHLFQNRFLSKKIENKEYFVSACRYIHQNPAKAKMEKTEKYKWSSYREYLVRKKIINPNMLLSILSSDRKQAKEEFIKIHNNNSNQEIYELMEYEMKENLTDEQLSQYICELLEINNTHEILNFNNKKRDEMLAKIKEQNKVKCSQLARVIGINRKIIERAKI